MVLFKTYERNYNPLRQSYACNFSIQTLNTHTYCVYGTIAKTDGNDIILYKLLWFTDPLFILTLFKGSIPQTSIQCQTFSVFL